jgi:DNA-binding transcriptional ArsR family regulator
MEQAGSMLEPDATIHQPTRLRIMMLLSGVKEADFKFLSSTLALTNGNLSVQACKLEEAGYIAISKRFEGKIPRTRYRLTDLGRRRLAAYWLEMDEIRATGQAGDRHS